MRLTDSCSRVCFSSALFRVGGVAFLAQPHSAAGSLVEAQDVAVHDGLPDNAEGGLRAEVVLVVEAVDLRPKLVAEATMKDTPDGSVECLCFVGTDKSASRQLCGDLTLVERRFFFLQNRL